jgi:farnesyl-diphosphate farnesyltransferase
VTGATELRWQQRAASPSPGADGGEVIPESDDAYQTRILEGVSRTFALTIPRLPARLARAVANAYLLCRIADTIEDEPSLPPPVKTRFSEQFIAVVAGDRPAEAFALDLTPRLSRTATEAERDLVANTARVIRITRSLSGPEQSAIERCVRIMAPGMSRFQRGRGTAGLRDTRELDRYCYCVAGVVGEMLTELFCAYSPRIALRRALLMGLAVSFGQGLQMTNILKDVWEDRGRGALWLPRDVFAARGFDLATLAETHRGPAFEAGLRALVAIARGHLGNALAYTLAIPRRERGIRVFCTLAWVMALLTLRNLQRRPGYASGADVKISRRAVKAAALATALSAPSNALLRLLFRAAAWGLPGPPRTRESAGNEASRDQATTAARERPRSP